MTIAQRLYLLIFTAIVGLASLAGLGLLQIEKVFTVTNVNTVPSLLALDEAFIPAAVLRVQVWQYLALSDAEKKSGLANEMALEHAKVIEALNKYEKEDLTDDRDKALLVVDRNALAEYDALREKVLALAALDKADDARDLLLANQTVFTRLSNAFDEHRKYNADLGYKGSEDAAAIFKNSKLLLITIALLVIVGTAAMALTLTRKIINGVNEAVKVAQTVAAGDLT